MRSRRLVLHSVPSEETEWVSQQFQSLIKKSGTVTVLHEISRQGPRVVIELNASKQCVKYAMTLFHRLRFEYKNRQEQHPNTMLKITDTFDLSDLVIMQEKDHILHAINQNQVVIIEAATGSGKSTAVPKIILDDRDAEGQLTKVICFQPRRIAAVSLAARVADASKSGLGNEVGYSIGGDSRSNEHTRILYCTSAIGMLHCLQVGRGIFLPSVIFVC